MPIEFDLLLSVDNYYFLSGLAGIVSAFVVLTIWSRGL